MNEGVGMYAVKRAWGKRWVRWVTMLILFVASGFSYPVFFRAIGQTYGFLDKIGVGFCLAALILVHELFHLWAMRRYNIEAIGPIPVPFLGAWVGAKGSFPSLWAKFMVVLCGPVAGLLAVPIFIVGFHVGSFDLTALAILWLLINAVNLLPLFPLDGGLAVAAVLGSIDVRLANIFVVFSLVVPLVAAYCWRSPVVAIVSLLAAAELAIGQLRRRGPFACLRRQARVGKRAEPIRMTGWQIAIAIGSYLGVCAIIAMSYFVTSHWSDILVVMRRLVGIVLQGAFCFRSDLLAR